MDKDLVQNINKSTFFSNKLKKVESLLKNKEYKESYKAVAALIEMACIIVLEKVYHEKVEDSNIVGLIAIFDKHGENELKQLLISINGEYNFVDFDKIQEIDILALIGNLDNFIKLVIEEHGNIF